MGSIDIVGSHWRLVEVGRVVAIDGDHPGKGRIGAIVEIIDHKRVRENQLGTEKGDCVEGQSGKEELGMSKLGGK